MASILDKYIFFFVFIYRSKWEWWWSSSAARGILLPLSISHSKSKYANISWSKSWLCPILAQGNYWSSMEIWLHNKGSIHHDWVCWHQHITSPGECTNVVMLHGTKPYVVESLFVGAVVVEWVYCLQKFPFQHYSHMSVANGQCWFCFLHSFLNSWFV